ncbi:MAG: hypothetical protein AB1898_18765 [Acidobacteriota bacterium]
MATGLRGLGLAVAFAVLSLVPGLTFQGTAANRDKEIKIALPGSLVLELVKIPAASS